MRKTIVCIFAHPDDEAFGPGGTIAKLTKDNNIYLICATKGEEGADDKKKDIGKIREKELLQSADILGIKKVFFLGFKDGQLCNNNYHDLAKKIKKILERLRPDTLITYEPHGVSGHIDHITVSFVTTYIFENLSYIKKALYFCHTKWQVKIIKTFLKNYFIYFPSGYHTTEIGLTVDINSTWRIKEKAIKVHHSQSQDVKRILIFLKLMPKKEHFLVLSK